MIENQKREIIEKGIQIENLKNLIEVNEQTYNYYLYNLLGIAVASMVLNVVQFMITL